MVTIMKLQCLYVADGTIEPVPASPLHSRLLDSTPGVYTRDETGFTTVDGYQYAAAAALSEGTITDSTPGSAVNHYAPSIEEGTLLSSISSYRSIAERPPGLWLYRLPICFCMLFVYFSYTTLRKGIWRLKILPQHFLKAYMLV